MGTFLISVGKRCCRQRLDPDIHSDQVSIRHPYSMQQLALVSIRPLQAGILRILNDVRATGLRTPKDFTGNLLRIFRRVS
jgi:hypothetical protein